MKKKEIIIAILAIIMLVFSVSSVFAAMNIDDDMEDIDEAPSGGIQRENVNLNLNSSAGNNSLGDNIAGNTTNSAVPNAGLERVPVVAVGACIVVAVIAYTKIKKYNV